MGPNRPKRSPALLKRRAKPRRLLRQPNSRILTSMQAFLEYVVKGLVDRPDAVTLAPVERNGVTVYELRVHPTDMGKIIGRQGATINAIRALLLVGSAKRGLRCALEVIDE